jgi:2-keto-3-deoxy-L-rhamnonate aldolase RhmA
VQNTALAQWLAKQKSIGVWLNQAVPQHAEMLAHLGFHWICNDLQHGWQGNSKKRIEFWGDGE